MTVELDSLGELEAALAAEEFDTARVYVGYRACAPSKPDPCTLPQVAYSLDPPYAGRGTFSVGPWAATWSEAEYAAAVGRVRDAIREGDVYQVNLVQHLRADFDGEPGGVAVPNGSARRMRLAPKAAPR